jgi:hypothetical protein
MLVGVQPVSVAADAVSACRALDERLIQSGGVLRGPGLRRRDDE